MVLRYPLLQSVLPCCAAIGIFIAGAGQSAAAATVPVVAVAVVTDLTGHGQLRRHGQQRPLAVLDTLLPQDQLHMDAGAAAELAFTAGAGSVIRLAGPGRFQVRSQDVLPRDPGAKVERRDLAAAWRGVRLRPGLIGRASIALRGLPATQVSLRSPIGGEAADGIERLQWDQPYGRHAGAWDYTVRVIDDQGSLVFASQSRERALDLPASLVLDRGRDYLWTVQAQADDRRHAYGAAEFHWVAADVEQRMRDLTKAVVSLRRDPARAESSAEEVLLALALEQAGLHNTAQRQWQALLPLRPALADAPAMRP